MKRSTSAHQTQIPVCLLCAGSSLSRKQSRQRDDKLLPPLLSPLSDEPPRKRPCDGGPALSQEASAASLLPCSTSSTSHRHRRGEGKAAAHARNGGVSAVTRDMKCCIGFFIIFFILYNNEGLPE